MSSSTTSRYRESAAVTAPSKVHDQSNTSFAEEHALDAIAKEAELRLQHQREQNREARQLRHKELEKNARDETTANDDDTDRNKDEQNNHHEEIQNEQENEDDLADAPPSNTSRSRLLSTDGVNNSAMGSNNNNTNSTLLQKFLNGDIDLRTTDQRDLRRLLSELESKYKAAMIANSSIYNEKQALKYQVDTFKDILDEHYEVLTQTKRQYKEKSRDFDLQKRALNELQQESNQLKQMLANREKLIEESGMQLLTEDELNGHHHDDKLCSVFPTSLITQETLNLLNSLGQGTIDEKLKQLINDKHEQNEELIQLKTDFERLRLVEKQQMKTNEFDNLNETSDIEQQKQLIKELNDFKNRIPRLEADHLSIQQENKRFDAQLKRQKQQIEEMEKIEEDLKQERRKLQREYRELKSRYDDILLENQRLQDRVDSMEFVRRNYHSSRPSIIGGGYPPLPPSTRSTTRAPSLSRFTSNERELDASIPPPYRSREPSLVRRNSREFSNDRWSSRRDSSTSGAYLENDSKTSNRNRPDRWSSTISPNFSSLPGRIHPTCHLRAAREELDNERTRSDVLQRENERLRTLRKKTLLTPNDDTLVMSTIISRSHTNSPLPNTISSSSSSSISTLNDPQLNPSTQDSI